MEWQVTFQRKLNGLETAALSVAVIAMTVGMALNTPFVAGAAGASLPLIFAVSTVGVLCIAFAFVRLSSRVSHAGSVYGLIRYAQGRSIGFVAGWALLLTYGIFVSAALFGFGLFASMLLDGIVHLPWPVYALGCAVAVWITNYRDIKFSTRIMLAIELLSILLMIATALVIFTEQPLTFAPFRLGQAGLTGFSHGLVFGVMTFVGFEAAASLSEEARHAARDVPFAIIATVLVAGLFFTFVSYAQVLGYGLDKVQLLSTAATPMNDLAARFIGRPATLAIAFCCAVSTFAMAVGSAAASSRLLLALSRDGFFTPSLSALNRFGSPGPATHLIMVLNLVLMVVLILWHGNASDLYGYTSTVATFTVIIAYAMMAAAALARFAREDYASGKVYLLAPPVIGIALLAYTLFVNIYPVPAYPFDVLPYIVIAYMLSGLIVLIPALRHRTQGEIDPYLTTLAGPSRVQPEDDQPGLEGAV